MAQAVKVAKPNVIARLGRYLADVRAEMRRVVWPSRTEVVNSSAIVLTTLVIFVILISIYDFMAAQLVKLVASLGGG